MTIKAVGDIRQFFTKQAHRDRMAAASLKKQRAIAYIKSKIRRGEYNVTDQPS